MNPKDFLKRTTHQFKSMKEMKSKYVAVGILESEATGRIYKNGTSVLEIAAIHEFGAGKNPERSFLRMPQQLKKKEIDKFTNKQLMKVFDGMNVNKGLGLIGTYATNISQDAFKTGGFGKWPEIEQSTINRKGSSAPLIDTGTLKNSISWEVR